MTTAAQLDLASPASYDITEATCLNRVQVAFEAMSSDSLIYRGDQPHQLLNHLARQVATNPKSLSLHVRRIFLSIQLADKHELYGALTDLCWVLENRGQLLLKRLIQQGIALLSSEQKSVLSSYLDNPDPDSLKQLDSQRSVLSNGRFSLQL